MGVVLLSEVLLDVLGRHGTVTDSSNTHRGGEAVEAEKDGDEADVSEVWVLHSEVGVGDVVDLLVKSSHDLIGLDLFERKGRGEERQDIGKDRKEGQREGQWEGQREGQRERESGQQGERGMESQLFLLP